MIGISLRLASVAILLLLLHQFFWSKGGSARHNRAGAVAMGIGALLVVLVTIRGAQQESLSPLYIFHLITGGPFFLALFATGLLGWKAKQRLELASTHRLVARVALILLCITLAVGVITRLSH